MKQAAKETSPLLPEQAFLVQFREATDLAPEHWEGRVEHVVSGEATSFHSLDELRLFVVRLLATIRTSPTE